MGFLFRAQNQAFSHFQSFKKRVEKEKDSSILRKRSDRGGEFINLPFITFCEEHGIKHELSCPRTPQQNGVVERKNWTLQEMARTMISEYGLPHYLWAEAVNASCYISNRVFLCKNSSKTSFEIYFSRKPNVSYFTVFGCKCFILNTKDNLGKFDARSYEAIFVGYSNTSKAYRVFNNSSLTIEESIYVKFEESNMFVKNVVEIDPLHEDMERITLKDSPTIASMPKDDEGNEAKENEAQGNEIQEDDVEPTQ